MWLWAGLIAFGTVLASLYTGPLSVGRRSAAMAAVTIALTFVLPVVHRPHAPDDDATTDGTRFHRPPGPCASFHKHRKSLDETAASTMTTYLSRHPSRDRYERRWPRGSRALLLW